MNVHQLPKHFNKIGAQLELNLFCGRIRHKDHATITLAGWHEVCMNREFFTETVAFLD